MQGFYYFFPQIFLPTSNIPQQEAFEEKLDGILRLSEDNFNGPLWNGFAWMIVVVEFRYSVPEHFYFYSS